MLYIAWMVILGDHNIIKISFENFDFSAAQGEKLHKQVVHWPHSLGHYWWTQLFRVFDMGFDRPPAGLETAKNVLSYTSRHILSNIPTHTPQSATPPTSNTTQKMAISRRMQHPSVFPSFLPWVLQQGWVSWTW